MKIQNKAINIIPPKRLNTKASEPNIVAIPRYIGFLEYVKIFSVTNFVACLGFNGLTVVLFRLNDLTADIRIEKPNNIKNMPT